MERTKKEDFKTKLYKKSFFCNFRNAFEFPKPFTTQDGTITALVWKIQENYQFCTLLNLLLSFTPQQQSLHYCFIYQWSEQFVTFQWFFSLDKLCHQSLALTKLHMENRGFADFLVSCVVKNHAFIWLSQNREYEIASWENNLQEKTHCEATLVVGFQLMRFGNTINAEPGCQPTVSLDTITW